MPLDKQHLDLVQQSLEANLGLVLSPALRRKSGDKNSCFLMCFMSQEERKKERKKERKSNDRDKRQRGEARNNDYDAFKY